MNCTECKERLVEYIEGLLSETQRQIVEEHLGVCRECRDELAELRELGERLNSDSDNRRRTNLEDVVFDRIICEQNRRLKRTDRINSQLKIWRKVMKSKITKYATAAAIILMVILSVVIFDKSVSSAFGIEQVITAYNNIYFLHVKQFKVGNEEPLEFWIKSDEQGNITNARYYLPEHVSPEDGAKLITWTPERAEIWFKRKGGYLIFQSKRIEDWMQSLLEQSQPKLVMKKLLEAQKAGKVDVDIQEPTEKQNTITIIATNKTKFRKDIYCINQSTDLITRIENYHIKNNGNVLFSTTEYYDYNVPIDEKMFTIEDEIPEDVTVVNQLTQLIGIPQGDMTDEQAAVETVRQFFQALIDKDYPKAGLILSGISEEKTKEMFGKLNVSAIISVGPPTAYPRCGPHSFSVPCEAELITTEGQKIIRKFGFVKARCGDDEMHPDRWVIHGGL